jgi:serine/threonine-protein kinase
VAQSTSDVPSPGERIGPCVLEERLGEGGMGIVFRAALQADGTPVAVKILRPELAHDDIFRRRFEHEARAACAVEDRHLVPIVDVGETEGRLYLVAAFIEGITLEHRLEAVGRLEIGELVRIIAHVGAGLDALHRAGIVHRDVKTSNILIDHSQMAMLTDFGVAKGEADTVLTRTGTIVGTLGYLAPELLRGAEASAASDLYALGCVAYECLAGQPPFGDRSLLELATAHVEEDPSDPGAGRDDATPGLTWAILRALSKDPAERPPTGAAFAAMLGASASSPG